MRSPIPFLLALAAVAVLIVTMIPLITAQTQTPAGSGIEPPAQASVVPLAGPFS